jgi:hypothetical protein
LTRPADPNRVSEKRDAIAYQKTMETTTTTTTTGTASNFLREKFDILLVTALFAGVLTAFLVFRGSDAAAYLKDVSNGLLYALLALLGVRRAAASGSTGTGDVNINQPPPADPALTQTAPADPAKENQSDSNKTVPIGDA